MVSFSNERWARVRETSSSWFEKKLTRPFTGVAVKGYDPKRPMPQTPCLSQSTCNDFSLSPEALIDRIDYEISQYRFYGDAFPSFNMDCFGPGVAAAFLGCGLDNSTGRVWFHPEKRIDICELSFTYDADNKYLKRIKDIYKAGMDRWQGNVIMGTADLGGIMDVLSSFFPGEELFYEMEDHPKEVKRLLKEISVLWQTFYDELQSVLQPVNPGYTDWSGLYSDKPSYIIQSDFSYMVGPAAFEEFIFSTIEDQCRRLDRTIYHLDGVGELPHLDRLLSIDSLDGIQWVPGAGNTPASSPEWTEIFEKVTKADKLHFLPNGGIEGIERIAGVVGNPGRIYYPTMIFEKKDEAFAIEALKKLKIEP